MQDCEWITPEFSPKGKSRAAPFAEGKARRDAAPRAIPPRGHPRDTITPWESLSKTRIFLVELLCFAVRACLSKRCSTIWSAERHSKTFWRDFRPSRVKWPSLLSQKQNTFCARVPKCAF